MLPDVLVLGDFVFDEWSTPQALPAGGKQDLKVTNLPGGARVVDLWGANDAPRQWQGILRGDNALDQALTLDQMRKAGEELEYSNGIEARTVVIEEFTFSQQRGFLEYSIRIITTDDSSGQGDGGGFGVSDVGSSVLSDLGSADGLVSGATSDSGLVGGTSELYGPPAPIQNAPLPPSRPSSLGGGVGVGAGDLGGSTQVA